MLHTAAVNVACAIKQKAKQADLHYLLGLILEETYYAQDMFGLKKEVIHLILGWWSSVDFHKGIITGVCRWSQE